MDKTDTFASFGELVFSEKVMETLLNAETMETWRRAKSANGTLDIASADAIAEAMKNWAFEKGCTHFCHWFQPLTGSTAEKHDSFVDKDGNGDLLLKFSGKSLIKGEPDASSFPSGGLRATFEARGYTYWDITSPAFIRDNILCIPSIFVSFNGESLGMKRPLLKSIDLIDRKATRLLNLLGYEDVRTVRPMIGLEQEYFLVDRPLFKKREDLYFTGRTLFGKMSPKGQELDDHYFGAIPIRVARFMKELNRELWRLGIFAKTEHNEVAPGQFELAVIYEDSNIAVDQNQIVMDILKRVAYNHGFACLLHEKPFKYTNGSGKHNNYSLVSDTGVNVFDRGNGEQDEMKFALFMTAFFSAVDKYPELLRLSVATAGNDHRLGTSEAPPAIISVYLGQYVEELIRNFALMYSMQQSHKNEVTEVRGISNLPIDNSDRNRTSPMAFTGNKFEFRMLGSSASGAFPNTVLNTILADTLQQYIDKLENVSQDKIRDTVREIIREAFAKHGRILFSGDGYSEEWVKEAERRGMPNIRSSIEAISYLTDSKNVRLLSEYGIYTEVELEARRTILIEQYISTVGVEVKTLLEIANNYIIPSLIEELGYYQAASLNRTGKARSEKLAELLDEISDRSESLKNAYDEINVLENNYEKGYKVRSVLVEMMEQLREPIDEYEGICNRKIYPLPTYSELLF